MKQDDPFREFEKIGAHLESVATKITERVSLPLAAIALAISLAATKKGK